MLSLVCGCGDRTGPQSFGPLYGVPDYGMPWAQYRVNGTVRAKATQQAIPGIEVMLGDTGALEFIADTGDSLGRYGFYFSARPSPATWQLIASDIDADSNGRFTPKDTIISIPESTLTGGDGEWYQGSAEKTVDIDLDT